ncbi:peptide/nickel transport system ATP-binding protein [Saccharicrinis carchari]|uniref:Nickel import system ATP-binding protein NikD n=1 Tax=Saccharicrinis carchari TaxID=1168039 RepID=A0A521AEF0_SACCC|nr:ABC transporter ATP-binding protein [Saccharicrinis carchari]SMO33183.1 peptide/nickel transport system ATP-binding protein [Saccharicrinis carchari]
MKIKGHYNTNDKKPLLEVKNLSLSFPQYKNGFEESQIQVIRDFELTICPGEIVAVVGSSGSGKSLLADSILGILPNNAQTNGAIFFEGQALTPKLQNKLRGKAISLIPQSIKALDPLMKTAKQVQSIIPDKKAKIRIQREAFDKLGLPHDTDKKYPFELSGGMARRVLIATAMVSEAKLIIADEPTPGLDEESWNETLSHIKQLCKANKAVLFITHDIHAALKIADKIAVFYAGETVEIANKKDFTGNGDRLRHPYTKALWRALPENSFESLDGNQPEAMEVFAGCVFGPRCLMISDFCRNNRPGSTRVNNGLTRCFYANS